MMFEVRERRAEKANKIQENAKASNEQPGHAKVYISNKIMVVIMYPLQDSDLMMALVILHVLFSYQKSSEQATEITVQPMAQGLVISLGESFHVSFRAKSHYVPTYCFSSFDLPLLASCLLRESHLTHLR